MNPKRRFHTSAALTAIALFALAGPAAAQTVFGALTNFDVFNDTGQESHGFEIELQGVSSSDILSTFGGTFIRYGDPKLVDFPGGVYVRYESAYDPVRQAFRVSTPIPPGITPTAGHQCWTGGAPGYASSGCEHFGVELHVNPAATIYRWLVADPAKPGALKPAGTNVSIMAPVWSVAPAAPGAAAVVNAALAPPASPAGQFGEAVWVKTYETESAGRVELNHLMTDDPAVPHELSQLEVEWELLQSNPLRPDKGGRQHGKPLGNGSQSVVRRYEFYKYTGAYDPRSHEALCGGGASGGHSGDSGCTPGPGELGDYIGAQMAAAHFSPEPPQNITISGVLDAAGGQPGIAAGSWVSVYGTNLSGTSRSWRDTDFLDDNLPKRLDGVTVTINGKPAAVCFISPGQLNVQAPDDVVTGPVQVVVTNPHGSASGTATIQAFAPGLFSFAGNYVAAVHADGALVAAAGAFGPAVATRPAKSGEVLMIFGTGFGATAPAAPAGRIIRTAAQLEDLSKLQIRIGGVIAQVQFAGVTGAGVYQLNVVIPLLGDGDQSVVAEIGGASSQRGLLIPIKN